MLLDLVGRLFLAWCGDTCTARAKTGAIAKVSGKGLQSTRVDGRGKAPTRLRCRAWIGEAAVVVEAAQRAFVSCVRNCG